MRTILRVLTTCSLALVLFLAGGGVMRARSADADYESLRRFSQVLDMVEQYYVKDVKQSELIDGALKGMLQGLDPHSTLLSAKEFQEMQESTSGEFFGVGVEITTENGQVLVVSPIEDTPGYKAGLRAGDIILAIDGQYSGNESVRGGHPDARQTRYRGRIAGSAQRRATAGHHARQAGRHSGRQRQKP